MSENLYLCIFEDRHFNRLYPLSLTRPAFNLRCGMTSLRDKIVRHYPNVQLSLFCREYLAEQLRESNPNARVNEMPEQRCLFINGRFLFDEKPPELSGQDGVWKHDGKIVAARLTGASFSKLSLTADGLSFSDELDELEPLMAKGAFVDYPWDLIHHNASEIEKDFAFLNKGGQIYGTFYPNVTLVNEKDIYVAESAKVKPGVVLDAEDGPVFIDENVTVMANAVLQGPVYVGPNSLIKFGAKIYEGTSIGETCKVGGEVEETIIHGFSNKQHEGFLGHAYLGEWVNLGADSNNSDLKNNYSSVKVYIDGELIDSGSSFVGLFMGDHSKSGINTMFNTGTVVGAMCNVFGAGYAPKHIPSFSWGGIESNDEHDLEKALETARRVMARRKRELTRAQEDVLKYVYQMTGHLRSKN